MKDPVSWRRLELEKLVNCGVKSIMRLGLPATNPKSRIGGSIRDKNY
jgi:hypothetical protein